MSNTTFGLCTPANFDAHAPLPGLSEPMSRRFATVLSALLLAFGTVGCGGEEGATPSSSGTSGAGAAGSKVVVDGSSTVYRISKAAQSAFSKVNDAVTVIVANHGTGGGFGRYLEGEVDIVDASRDAKKEEAEKAKEKGLDWTRFLVGYDGITVVVNRENTFVKSLTVEQLKKLFEPGSKVTKWKDLDPSWPDRKIVLYSPDNDSGTFEFFTEAIIKQKAQRKDVQESPDDNLLVRGVEGDTDGLGYFGYAYYAENKDRLRAVPIQNGPDAKPVEPSTKTVLSKEYAPLSRPLYIFVKNTALKRPEVAEFVKYYIEHGAELAKKAGYVAPTEADLAENRKALGGAA